MLFIVVLCNFVTIIITLSMVYGVCQKAHSARSYMEKQKVTLWKVSGWLALCLTYLAGVNLVTAFFSEYFGIGDFLMDVGLTVAVYLHFL